MPRIHPTALVDPGARLADDVEVGPYSIVGPDVSIGAGTVVGPHVVLAGRTAIGERNNQVAFRVMRDATKPEIKAAVELMFSTKDKKIEVVSVQVANVKGKVKRFGRFMGRRNHWKKAYVRLKAGQEINFAAGEAK